MLFIIKLIVAKDKLFGKTDNNDHNPSIGLYTTCVNLDQYSRAIFKQSHPEEVLLNCLPYLSSIQFTSRDTRLPYPQFTILLQTLLPFFSSLRAKTNLLDRFLRWLL